MPAQARNSFCQPRQAGVRQCRLPARLVAALVLLLTSFAAFGTDIDIQRLIDQATALNIRATLTEAEAAIGLLAERLDQASPRQREQIHLLRARHLALGGDYRSGIDVLRRLLDQDIGAGNRLKALELAANMLLQVADYHEAFHYLNQALEMAPEAGDPASQAHVYSLASYWFVELGAAEEGMDYARRALTLSNQFDNAWQECVAFEKVGLAYHSAGNIDMALWVANRALNACREAGDQLFSSAVMTLLGKLHHQLGNADEAERWLTQGIALAGEAGYTDGELLGQLVFGRALFDLGRHDEAEHYLVSAIEGIEARQRWRSLTDGHYLLARIATERGEYERAFTHMQHHLDANERHLESQRERLIAFHEVHFGAQERDQELALLREQARVSTLEEQARRQQQRLQTIGYGLITILVIVLLLLLTHAVRERRHYRRLSRRDSLTGLHNHTSFFESATRELHKAQYKGQPLTLVLADVDHFKNVNDRHGHLAGDEVLRRIAARLRESFGKAGVVGRLGGEEFGVVLSGEDAAAACVRIADFQGRMQKSRSEDPFTPVTMSFGVAELDGEDAVTQLRKKADQALYQAKRSGRDQTVTAGSRNRPEKD